MGATVGGDSLLNVVSHELDNDILYTRYHAVLSPLTYNTSLVRGNSWVPHYACRPYGNDPREHGDKLWRRHG